MTAKHLVLVGGGHAHIEVLCDLVRAPEPTLRITAILDRRLSVYTGMVPGVIAGDYAPQEATIDVTALAERAGAAVILKAARAVEDGAARLIDGDVVGCDGLSLNVGSTMAPDVPGVSVHAVAARPIATLVERLTAHRSRDARNVVVVGSGAAGVELGFVLKHRLSHPGHSPHVTVVGAAPRALPRQPVRVSEHLERIARAAGVVMLHSQRVTEVRANAVATDSRDLPSDLTVWAAGATPPSVVQGSALPKAADGFISVDRSLRVVGSSSLFAAGDCATLIDESTAPKSGVAAVRQGEVLARNLRAWARRESPERYTQQHHALCAINLGGQRAFVTKYGLSVSGRLAWQLKDFIDRRYIGRSRI